MIALREYQQTSKQWLLEHPRIVLGDDMGIGKSYPAIEAALELPAPRLLRLSVSKEGDMNKRCGG
jgi:hypothetical protein